MYHTIEFLTDFAADLKISPNEIADAVVWLLSDEARYVTGHTRQSMAACVRRRATRRRRAIVTGAALATGPHHH
jgi:hypothetical protein